MLSRTPDDFTWFSNLRIPLAEFLYHFNVILYPKKKLFNNNRIKHHPAADMPFSTYLNIRVS